jgi:predicted DNA-binding transcriptional regulator AlpA
MHIIRAADLAHITGLSRTTIWRLERRGQFPQRIRLSRNTVGWRLEEIRDWIESRPRGMTQLDAFDREAQV